MPIPSSGVQRPCKMTCRSLINALLRGLRVGKGTSALANKQESERGKLALLGYICTPDTRGIPETLK